jgi:hypothetical protein
MSQLMAPPARSAGWPCSRLPAYHGRAAGGVSYSLMTFPPGALFGRAEVQLAAPVVHAQLEVAHGIAGLPGLKTREYGARRPTAAGIAAVGMAPKSAGFRILREMSAIRTRPSGAGFCLPAGSIWTRSTRAAPIRRRDRIPSGFLRFAPQRGPRAGACVVSAASAAAGSVARVPRRSPWSRDLGSAKNGRHGMSPGGLECFESCPGCGIESITQCRRSMQPLFVHDTLSNG